MDWFVALTAFAVVFPAELPDKTFVATLVLSTRFRPLWVWIGVALAFLVQTLVAVLAGGLLSLLPDRWVAAGTAVLFAVGSIVLWRGARNADVDATEEEHELTERLEREGESPRRSAWVAIGTSFGILFLAEWGDLSQLATAGLAARTGEPLSVFVGAWLALATVAAIGVIVGRTLLRWVRPSILRRVAGTLFAILAVLAALEAAGLDMPF